jgi:arylsulfatase A-like enzyme/acetyl esterase/lipase
MMMSHASKGWLICAALAATLLGATGVQSPQIARTNANGLGSDDLRTSRDSRASSRRDLQPSVLTGARTEVYKRVDETELRMHIFEPADGAKTNRAAIVFFFGGGWNSGSPQQFEEHCRHFAERGMVAMAADYRVRSRHGVQVVSCVADAKSAIGWVRENAGRLGIDPHRIAAGGGSAGGHLAAATATLPGFDEAAGADRNVRAPRDVAVSSVPDALVLFNPALALAPLAGFEARELEFRMSEERLGADAKALSPAHHVKTGVPPTIIFHGREDQTVPYASVEVFARLMREAGNRCELVGYDGQGHGFFNVGRSGERYFRETLARADEFLVSLGFLVKGNEGRGARGEGGLSPAPAVSPAPRPSGLAPAPRPNFVFLMADDLGWTDLKGYGSSFHETPNIDQLARDGMRFATFYTAGSVCSPTRASIMTGKYPPRTGITDWIPGQHVTGRKLVQLYPRRQLALEELTLAEAMKDAGYETMYAGKWHLGGEGFQPTNQGFETYIGDAVTEKNETQEARLKRLRESTEHFTSGSIEFLRNRNREKPFLLFLSYHDVHTPIQSMPGLVESYEQKASALPGETPTKSEHDGKTRLRQDNAAYASMVAAVDGSVGRLRAALAELGLAENTIVFFTSDNGGLSTLRNPGPTSNEPLRAGKGWLYEGGIRVPLIVSGPGVKRGAVSDAALISNDFYPTLLELAGLPARPQQHLDGVSFATLLRGGPAPAERAFYWHYPHYHGSTWTPGAAVREGDWKLIQFYDYEKVELYNLKRDPSESKDVSESNAKRQRELLNTLRKWQKSVGAEMPVANQDSQQNGAGGKRLKGTR